MDRSHRRKRGAHADRDFDLSTARHGERPHAQPHGPGATPSRPRARNGIGAQPVETACPAPAIGPACGHRRPDGEPAPGPKSAQKWSQSCVPPSGLVTGLNWAQSRGAGVIRSALAGPTLGCDLDLISVALRRCPYVSRLRVRMRSRKQIFGLGVQARDMEREFVQVRGSRVRCVPLMLDPNPKGLRRS